MASFMHILPSSSNLSLPILPPPPPPSPRPPINTSLSFPLLDVEAKADQPFPTMSNIMEVSRAQNLRLQLRTLGPFFRVTAVSWEDETLEVGRAEGVIRPWINGKVLHLDSMRMSRATKVMERSIFGLGLFVGAAAIRHGYDNGCTKAELLAIYDSDLYHSKLVRFYKRMGFKAVREIDGSSLGDLPHMLMWGGQGTRMDANIEELMLKWSRRFKPPAT